MKAVWQPAAPRLRAGSEARGGAGAGAGAGPGRGRCGRHGSVLQPAAPGRGEARRGSRGCQVVEVVQQRLMAVYSYLLFIDSNSGKYLVQKENNDRV